MSGEREGGRDARDRMAKQLRDAGMAPDLAKKKATDAAVRFDRQNPKK